MAPKPEVAAGFGSLSINAAEAGNCTRFLTNTGNPRKRHPSRYETSRSQTKAKSVDTNALSDAGALPSWR
jgi:hypothetical protein